jgi:hypothetical protein
MAGKAGAGEKPSSIILFNSKPRKLIIILAMDLGEYDFTEYFEREVLRKRPYLRKEWCIRVIEKPIRVEPQEHNRF